MKKLLLSTLLFLLLAPFPLPLGAQEVGLIAWAWDPTSTSYTYCRYTGQGGDPMGGSIPGPGLIETVGSNTHFVESVTDSLPFAELAVGDVIEVKLPTANTWLKRAVMVKTSGADVTVDTATDLGTVGVAWRYLKRACGTAATDGWFGVGSYDQISFLLDLKARSSTSVDTRVECRIQSSTGVALESQTRTTLAAYSYALTVGAWESCRLGIKVTGDAAGDNVDAYFSGGRAARSGSESFDGAVAFADATATAFVRLTVADDDYEGCGFTWIAYAEDSDTDARQVRTGRTHVSILNNSGTEACVFSTGDSAVGVTAGTLTCTFDCLAGTDTVDLRANCNTSLDTAAETTTFEWQELVCPSTVTTVTPQ